MRVAHAVWLAFCAFGNPPTTSGADNLRAAWSNDRRPGQVPRFRQAAACLLIATAAARVIAVAPERPLDPREILALMEGAADWQLQHPCSFELRWRQPGGLPDGHLRVGWDGTVMRRFTLDPLPVAAAAVTPEWGSMIGLAEGKLGFADLPAEVRRAWQVETRLEPEVILSVELLDEGATRSWEMATLCHGLSALADISPRASYWLALRQVAEANEWRLGRRLYHADDHAVGMLYLDFSRRENNPQYRADVEARFDWIMRHSATQSIDIRAGQDRWSGRTHCSWLRRFGRGCRCSPRIVPI